MNDHEKQSRNRRLGLLLLCNLCHPICCRNDYRAGEKLKYNKQMNTIPLDTLGVNSDD